MHMYLSMFQSQWSEAFRTNGIKAGDLAHHTSNGVPVLLCQSEPFPLGEPGDGIIIIVSFNKSLSEIYVDHDDLNDAVEHDLISPRAITYEGANEAELSKTCMYGSYVKEIKPDEITGVFQGKWVGEEFVIIK